ncbi:hypothetical protein DM02DRAFT_713699 [Periconia macrospinosa]|uniref:Uncharacterized protein n=1 Tax=Periconia macrospinosa TaxID=97972 RepID=A0A2V1ECI9_9PLEO|nr:hypothetical protein DM02DRAFT_713699 [Periconia macrospinosa]
MVYHWDGKEAECYRLYVQEKKSLDEVIEYWEQRGFTPSKRAFQTQFKRWDFPSKQNPAHKNPALIARVKELWEQNYTQKDMLETLQAENFSIIDRELMRLRLRYKWFLREARTGSKRARTDDDAGKERKKKKAKVVSGNGMIDQLANAILQNESSSEEESEDDEPETEQTTPAVAESQEEPADQATALQRQMRQEQMRAESDEKWRTRKRRRRTRGWAGLPADAPGEPPRFPSETTIDESKAYLSLDNAKYKEIRDQFQAICEEQDIIKKTVAGPEVWERLLQRLIRENPHLTNVFGEDSRHIQQNNSFWKPKDFKSLSLDVICQDVTKRMRVMNSRMSLAEAKNIMGLNPEQTRQVRNAFLAILKNDHFTNKFEAGQDHWNGLKRRWVQESDILRGLINLEDSSGQQDSTKLRAIEVLARDVMKRFRSEERNAMQQPKQVHRGPGPGPAGPTLKPTGPRKVHQKSSSIAPSSTADFEIDPSLLLAASDASLVHPEVSAQPEHSAQVSTLSQQTRPSFNHDNSSQPNFNTYAPVTQAQSALLQSGPLPIYFRLHALSSTPLPSKTVWLSVLQAGTLAEVKSLAMREHPGTTVVRLEGLIAHGGASAEREIAVTIDDDAELAAFLGHVGNGKATFVVLLSMGGNSGFM